MKLRDIPDHVLQPMKQLQLDLHNQLIVDLFAGGGGASVAMEQAWGRSPDIAVNHSDDALSMHRMNHPQTRHFIADVYEVNPRGAAQGRQVGWLHLSPDCTHFSQAAGRERSIFSEKTHRNSACERWREMAGNVKKKLMAKATAKDLEVAPSSLVLTASVPWQRSAAGVTILKKGINHEGI